MKSIPISKIDALMTAVEDFGEDYRNYEVIELLEELKKEESEEMIPSLSPSELQAENTMLRQLVNDYRKEFRKREKMIPLSTVEARIKELESYPADFWKCYDDHNQMLIDELKELTKDKDTKDK